MNTDDGVIVDEVAVQFAEARNFVKALIDEINRSLDQLQEPLDRASCRPPYRIFVAAGLRRLTRLIRAQLALVDADWRT